MSRPLTSIVVTIAANQVKEFKGSMSRHYFLCACTDATNRALIAFGDKRPVDDAFLPLTQTLGHISIPEGVSTNIYLKADATKTSKVVILTDVVGDIK